MPLAEFAVPNAVTGRSTRTRTSPRTTARRRRTRARRARGAPPPARSTSRGRSGSATSSTGPWCSRSGSRGGRTACPTQDILNRLAARYRGRVNFLSIDVRDDPADVRRIAMEHHWTMPVGYDRDGAVSDLYRVGGCPDRGLRLSGRDPGLREGAAQRAVGAPDGSRRQGAPAPVSRPASERAADER